ncbi:MAG: SurA N-terminal domain-containing protein [Xanthobacteraceae bacterium]|jgi:peptidyl-prolyl cis-trans isomerase D
MLRGLRKASSNWLGKVVMAAIVGFLVISFAIWGIGDIFRGFGRSTVAKVGGTEVTVEQFRVFYNERLQQIARQVGRPVTMDQARAMGLDRMVLGQLISEILLDERARKLGLNVSDAEVSRRITTDPTFQGPNGQFDRFRFEQMIRSAGYTEARFVAERRREMLRNQLQQTVTSGLSVPNAWVDAANRYRNEERSIEYVLLDRAQAGELPAPTPEVLAKYYEDRKILFRAPEYRKLVIVALIPSEQAHWIEISDADLKKAYEERRSRYSTPERRHIQQIVFPNAEEARAAADRISKGATFAEIAKERGLTDKDIDLGTLAKAAVIDRAVADAAFALKEGEVSAPVAGRFGTALVQVLKIEPEHARSYEEVAAELKKELAAARAKADILSIYDKIEDARSEGKPLAEAAASLKLASRTIEAIDRSGRDPSGAPVTGLPDAQRLLTTAFTTEMGIDRDPLQVEGGYIWFEIAGITPSRERPLDEVKEQVEARWREQEITTRLKTKAAEILDKLKAGSSLADVAAAGGLKVATLTGIKRGEPPAPLSAATVDVIFRTAKGAFASAEAAQPAEQVVFRVTDIVVPQLDAASEDAKQAQDTLNRSLTQDVLSEYLSRLETETGVTINQSALNQVVGGGAAGTN